jgi:hypothetical protein
VLNLNTNFWEGKRARENEAVDTQRLREYLTVSIVKSQSISILPKCNPAAENTRIVA